jgi:dihydropteroate synthase
MAAAANAGACIVNDVHALRAHGARAWAAEAGVGVCLMHMQGEPRTMQHNPVYQDVVAEVCEFLTRERAACIEAGIAREAIVLDPGVGFGKGFEHNMALFKALPRIAALGSPLLVGVSRKSFIGRLLEPSPIGAGIEASAPNSSAAGRSSDERLYGGIALAALAVSKGARIVRTHDVAATYDALRVVSAVLQ